MIKKSCKNCEFAMPNAGQIVCAGRSDDYGRDVSEMMEQFPDGCKEWEISFAAFQNLDCKSLCEITKE